MSIKSSDISVVVQGAVDATLLTTCVQSIRRQLPKAEIILSTWEGTRVDHPEAFDKIVYSADPGAKPISIGSALNNTNRQIVSTRQGLRVATRPYTLKFRTDCSLDGTGFLDAFPQYSSRNADFALFQHKVVVPRYASRIETSKRPYLFHPSDIALFGLTSDILRLFDVPLVTDAEFNWVEASPDLDTRKFLHGVGMKCRLVPEQHLFIQALRKSGFQVDLPHPQASSPELAQISRALLVNNYVVVEDRAFGVHHLKEKLRLQIPADSTTCYSKAQYEYVYGKYFSPEFRLDWQARTLGKSIADFRAIEGLLKHGTRIFVSRKLSSFHEVITECIVTLYWLFRCLFVLLLAGLGKPDDINLPSSTQLKSVPRSE